MSSRLDFKQLSCSINPSFWNKLSELKLEVYRLDETGQGIWGYFDGFGSSHTGLLEVDSTSFNSEYSGKQLDIPFHGRLYNKNTLHLFKEWDKTTLINQEGKLLYEDIINGCALETPSLLNRFFVLSFADLKKYHFYYWFAYPVPRDLTVEMIRSYPVTNDFSDQQLEDIFTEYIKMDDHQRAYFMIYKRKGTVEVHTLTTAMNLKQFKSDTNRNSFYFVFHNIASPKNFVGTQLRNYVSLILNNCDFLQNQEVNSIAFHLSRVRPKVTCKESIVYQLKLPSVNPEMFKVWVGWEKNERDRLGPRLAKMRDSLDPEIIAENSVDLNLKLMKWNLLPDLNLEKIKKQKFLLLGAGTLGCNVARTLLAWGAKNITFVDNSTVSFSNPVRQSLYSYDDSLRKKLKALAAADNLKTIFPGINSTGHTLTIPMPGHTVGESMRTQTEDNVNTLLKLIKDHDVIFLLLDSRESRWLPTLLSSLEKKIVINAALGFDSFMVMRHGIFEPDLPPNDLVPIKGFKAIKGNNLACYFCNDVTAPGNSLRERTLDQQCTITRPGVSMIAGALAVEMAISVLQHRDGLSAPAYYTTSTSYTSTEAATLEQSVLGMVPHSIRGFLSSYEQILPATEKYGHCVACSKFVINEYKEKGMAFLMNVFNGSKHLEDVTLLSDLFKDTDFAEILEFDVEEDFPTET